jgi:DNA polymerase-1
MQSFLKGDRIKTSFVHWKAPTGRIYCADYNLQALPDAGRSCIIPEEGMVFANVDYKAIEMRILFSVAGQEDIFAPILDGLDIHSLTYSRMKGKALEDVTDEERSVGKILNFGICYGQSSFSLANRLNIRATEARGLIDDYFNAYPKLKSWMKETRRFAKANGYVENHFGYRRDLKEEFVKNFRSAYRMAINTQIQSASACVLKLALEKLIDFKDSRIHLTPAVVHDSILLEIPKDTDRKEVEKLLKDNLEFTFKGWIPLELDLSWGTNWKECS